MNTPSQDTARARGMAARPMKLEIRNLVKTFGDFTAVKDVSFAVRKGEFLTLLGGSGSGKSTILNMIAGLDFPTSGDVLIDGKPITRIPPHRRNLGMVFQRYTLFPHMTAEENVAFPLGVRGIAREERMARAHEALKLVRLDAFARRMPSQLSGGQQQRVAIARALIYEPEILLMDEPLGALDRKLREEIQDELRQLHNRLDVTVIYVTHDQEEALRMSDTIAVMHNGEILQMGSGEDLYLKPAVRYVASFMGTSNIVEGRAAAWRDGMAHVLVAGRELLAPHPQAVAEGAKVWLMFRPERAAISAEEPVGGGLNALPVRVQEFVFLGEIGMTTAAGPGGESFVIRHVGGAPQAGSLARDSGAFVSWPVAQTRLYAE